MCSVPLIKLTQIAHVNYIFPSSINIKTTTTTHMHQIPIQPIVSIDSHTSPQYASYTHTFHQLSIDSHTSHSMLHASVLCSNNFSFSQGKYPLMPMSVP